MWEMITGKKPAKSTLPNRYARLKANIEAVKEDDKPKLFEAKKTVEERFEREKWNQIAAAMKELGTDDYTVSNPLRSFALDVRRALCYALNAGNQSAFRPALAKT